MQKFPVGRAPSFSLLAFCNDDDDDDDDAVDVVEVHCDEHEVRRD